jgi:hypothetical protein
MIKGLIDQTGHKKPGNLDKKGQEDKPEISLSKGMNNAFKFTKTEIYKSCTEKKDQ